jgi:virginiamycin A acetyltransferase
MIVMKVLNFIRAKMYIKGNVNKSAFINPNSRVNKYVDVGAFTRINGPCFLMGTKKYPINIGRYAAIGHNLRIRSRNHSTHYANIQDVLQTQIGATSLDNSQGEVKIGNSVWIGDNVTILSGVKVGNGAVIGAGSVVTKDIESFSIWAGVPAKYLKNRFQDEVKSFLSRIEWWYWDRSKIESNVEFFSVDLSKNVDLSILESNIK